VVALEGVNTIFPSMSDTFNWFPQKRKFPSKYAYSNRTFTFGKQTTENFIYKMVQWRSTHSFIFSFSCRFFFGESREGSSRRGTGIPRDQQQFQIVLLAPHQDGTKQGRRCSHATWSLDKLWAALPLVFSVAWWT